MKIVHVVPNSLVDFPAHLAAVVFVAGCNFRCPFCHNPELVLPSHPGRGPTRPEPEVLDFLRHRVGFLDGVVLTGGEPILQPDLSGFIERIRALGYAIKLDTNGSDPESLERLLQHALVDYVAMDVKAPLARYEALAGVPIDSERIRRSIRAIIERAPDYEFRTTVAPTLTRGDLRRIADLVRGAKRFVLQSFVVPSGKDLLNPMWGTRPALSRDELAQTWGSLKGAFPHGGIR